MTRWGEVSYRVKRAISFHERFTISQIADSTGLTYEQVEQVVHRLVDRGDVRRLLPEELTEAEQRVEERVGRPCARYALTDDLIRRAEFLADLEAVAAALRLQLAPDRHPDTPYYAAALQAIEAMESGKERARLSRLKEIEEFLVYGREYEALVPEGLEIVQAYYDLALARLKVLGSEFAAAEQLLKRAGEALARAGLKQEAYWVTEQRLALEVERELAAARMALSTRRDPLPILERLCESLRQAPQNPLFSSLHHTVELLADVIALGPQVGTAISEVHLEMRVNTLAVQQQAEVLARLVHTVEQMSPRALQEGMPSEEWPVRHDWSRHDAPMND